MISRAWISMSAAWPEKPPETWWIRILAFGQRHPLAGGAAAQQQGAHAHRDADADRLHVRLDELHRVVDREAGVDAAARRVDVEADVLVRVLGLEVEELGDDQVRDVLGDRACRGRRCARSEGASRCRTRARRARSARRPLGSVGSCHLSGALRLDVECLVWNTSESRRRAAILATGIWPPGRSPGPRPASWTKFRASSSRPVASAGAARSCPRNGGVSSASAGRVTGAGRPQLRGALLLALLLRRPELLARLRLAGLDRLGAARRATSTALRSRSSRADGNVAARLLEPLEQLLGLGAPRARRSPRAPRAAPRRRPRCPRRRRPPRARSRAPAAGARPRLASSTISSRVLPDAVQVGLGVDALRAQRPLGALPHLLGARRDELVGQLDVGLRRRRRRPPPGGTRPRSSAPARARACARCRRAARRACRTRSPRRRSRRRASGSSFSLTSLTCDLEDGVLALQLLGVVLVRERRPRPCASRPRVAPTSCSSKPSISRPPPISSM